jgi:hypothetical protein
LWFDAEWLSELEYIRELSLYESCGFQRIGPFGEYRDDPFSVFYEKTIL